MDRRDALARIVALLNEAMLDDARWPETSALIDEAVGAKGSVLTFGGEVAKGNVEIYFSRAFYRGVDRSAWQREYFRDYHGHDEHLRRLRALPDGRIVPVAKLLGNARTGIIHLDRGGRIVGANDRALALLRRRDGLADRHGALRAASREDDRGLQELLSRALPRFGGHGASGSMTVRRPSLLPRFAVHVKPVTNGEADYRSRQVAALVLIVDPVERARVDPALVEAALGLTPAQAGIAVLLAQARTPRQTAAATGRRYGTVRTHLKQIYARLGVARQLDVVPLVLALSTLPAPGEQGVRPSDGVRVAGTRSTSRRGGSDPVRARSGAETAVP